MRCRKGEVEFDERGMQQSRLKILKRAPAKVVPSSRLGFSDFPTRKKKKAVLGMRSRKIRSRPAQLTVGKYME